MWADMTSSVFCQDVIVRLYKQFTRELKTRLGSWAATSGVYSIVDTHDVVDAIYRICRECTMRRFECITGVRSRKIA